MSAGIVATSKDGHALCDQAKRLEVWVNNEMADIALVDVAALAGGFAGARAVWDVSALRQVAVTRASPTNIGLSAVVGMFSPISVEDDFGGLATIGPALKADKQVSVPLGPALIEKVPVAGVEKMEAGKSYSIVDERPLVIALDGERELILGEGDSASLMLRRNGPWIVDIERTMHQAASNGFFLS
jgi:hypothetical protein